MSSYTPNGGYTDPNFPNPNGPDDARIVIYGYIPNLGLCIFALVLYLLALTFHSYRLIRHRTLYFIPIILSCLLEILGFLFRTLSSVQDPYRITFYILEYFFITIAPIFTSASIYVCLSKLLHWSSASVIAYPQDNVPPSKPRYLNPKAVLWIFITADVLTTIIQITGAALVGKATSKQQDPTKYNNVLLAGLAIQMAFNFLFLLGLSYFLTYIQRAHELRKRFWPRVKVFSMWLFVAAFMVFTRTVFRVAESAQGVLGYAETHEVFFGVFEFAPIVVAVVLLAVWHPGPLAEQLDSKARFTNGGPQVAETGA